MDRMDGSYLMRLLMVLTDRIDDPDRIIKAFETHCAREEVKSWIQKVQ